MPGNLSGLFLFDMRKIEPSGAGTFSIAVLSEIRAPGKNAAIMGQRCLLTSFSGNSLRFFVYSREAIFLRRFVIFWYLTTLFCNFSGFKERIPLEID